jgi:hypothetical protein
VNLAVHGKTSTELPQWKENLIFMLVYCSYGLISVLRIWIRGRLKKTWKFKNRHDDFDFKRILRSFYFISFSKFWDVFREIKVEGAQKSKMPLYVQCTVHSVWGSTFFKNKAIYSFIFYRYQKIRLRAFIPKMQTYLIEKMHLNKIILKKQKIF